MKKHYKRPVIKAVLLREDKALLSQSADAEGVGPTGPGSNDDGDDEE